MKQRKLVRGSLVTLDTVNFGWGCAVLWSSPNEGKVSHTETIYDREVAVVVNICGTYANVASTRGVTGWIQTERITVVL